MKNLTVVLSLLIITASACKKNPANVEPTHENISGTYMLKALSMSTASVPEQDAMPFMKDCEKDDLYELNPDYSFHHADAGVSCDPANNFEGTWELDGNRISFYGDTGTITKFDGRIMEVTVVTTEQATTYNIKSTFEKQVE